MTKHKHIVKINLSGGIVSVGDLLTIVKAAEMAQAKEIRLGTRQQLYLTVTEVKLSEFSQTLMDAKINFEVNFDEFPNIVSSYVTEELFNHSTWLSEGVYADVLDAFYYRPKLKVNIVDATQNLVPFFTGNLNFISSNTPNYWYLYVRFPKMTETHPWPELIYTSDIPLFVSRLEEVIFHDETTFHSQKYASVELLKERLEQVQQFSNPEVVEDLQLPKFTIPYYEGLNSYGKKYWLGVYRRDETFSIEFLKDICAICLKTKIGKLYTTPWKSILIKGIDPESQRYWSYILGKHRINVRHAFNELNWQVEDLSNDGLLIKRYLVKRFDSLDLKTHGLCFAIKTQPRTGIFGSVVIKKLMSNSRGAKKSADRFDILYTPDFNPNSKNYVFYKKRLPLNVLADRLTELSHRYYDQIGLNNLIVNELKPDEPVDDPVRANNLSVHQCQDCHTVYDQSYGEPENGIVAGEPFDQLPKDYACPVCNADKDKFVKVNYQSLISA